MLRHLIILALLGACAGLLQGCTTLAYYAQSANGEMQVLAKRQPISTLIANPDTRPHLRARLELARRMRNFASRELALPDNASYRSYADLHRPYVVWNVFAAPRFSLQPKRWCFPFTGCVAYRGYFARDDAERFAAALRRRHYDVYVAGIPAYSTLGWFSDPLLNTVINWPEPDLAGLIFHELAHQKLYVRGDTAFNESFAVTVEREGVRRWMRAHGTPGAYREYLAEKRRDRAFVRLVMTTRTRLQALYASHQSTQELAARKRAVFLCMRADFQRLKSRWGGYRGYDRWMMTPLNNAKIASVATYEQYVPAFRALLRREHGDFKRFYAAARAIGELPTEQRHARLRTLMATGAVGSR
jgi:predicted aminopeptidase